MNGFGEIPEEDLNKSVEELTEQFKKERAEFPSITSAFWQQVKNFFIAGMLAVWTHFFILWRAAWKEYNVFYKEWETRVVDVFIRDLLGWAVDKGMLDKDDLDNYKTMIPSIPVVNLIACLALLLGLILLWLKLKTEFLLGTYKQTLNIEHSPNPPGAGEVMRAAFIAPEKINDVRLAMRRNGLAESDIDLMFIANYQLYDVLTIRSLYFRKVLSEDQVFERLREHGFTDTRIKEIMQDWALIPPVNDIIRMAVRETFTPEIAEKYGQFEDFPEPFAEWSEKQGLSSDWAKRYWAAHWELPSPQMGYDMLHRGVIDEEELKLLLRALDVMPYWRDKLMKISFNPFTRVDVRRMHATGVLTDDELIQNYKDAGYDQYHAEKLAQFTISYNKQGMKDVTKAQVITAYNDKLITREDTLAYLLNLGYDATESEFLLSIEDYREVKSVQDDIIAAAKDKFINNYIEKQEAIDILGRLNLPSVKINSLLERWEISRIKGAKLISKTDLDKFWGAQIINDDQYRTEMTRLGYSWYQITWFMEYQTKQREKANVPKPKAGVGEAG